LGGRGARNFSRYKGRRRVLPAPSLRPVFLAPPRVDRSSLLISTALASTLLAGLLFAPTSASAQTTPCSGGPAPGPTPILEASAAPIICVNTDDRTSNGTSPDAINLLTTGAGNFITLSNSGVLTAARNGILSETFGDNSFIDITN